MDLLEKNEHFWQRLFDGLFRRGGEVALQPVEIAKKLAKVMVARRTISVNNVYVPNVYLVNLSPYDFERLSVFEHSLARELEDYISKKAAEQNYTLVGKPRVEFEVEDELTPGEMRVAARMEEEPETASGNVAGPAAEEGDTLIYRAIEEAPGPPEEPVLKLAVLEGPDAGRTFLLQKGRQVLGRQPACDFVLTDEQVSRRHCQVEESHDRVLVTDLGSRNGTMVNGRRVERAFLKPGDRLQVGRSVLELQVS
ncbi:hypothetical protein MTAT_11540 [Moorella thermoacetica]|uniref:Glycogen accumulation regulator GarA n=1 Tax=Neomoorella thermoacetica TaxID=1525 RepID=A0AAC9HGV3_NEOTH|nr:DUF3662 and FHA domain-containing protein [Moorella thermoacetica]AOQ23572.1 Glycogen accumulation regulator GarA [Moorella thermoacetica]TYL13756.1 hypothetical protein MTAT_11540 [Moorella thermoacetica]